MKKCLIESAEAKLAEHVAKDDQQSDVTESEIEETSNVLGELESEDFDDLSVIDEAASLTTSAFDLLQQNYEDSFSRISNPDHLRFHNFM
jgi:hypothetical protein